MYTNKLHRIPGKRVHSIIVAVHGMHFSTDSSGMFSHDMV